MSSFTATSADVLRHLHRWQRRAGLPTTNPRSNSAAYVQQWQAIERVLAQESTSA